MKHEEAIVLIRDAGPPQHAEALIERLSPSVRLFVQESPDAVPGNAQTRLSVSHFGGLPSLPNGCAWPTWDKRAFLEADIAAMERRLEAKRLRASEQPERVPGLNERLIAGSEKRIAQAREEMALGEVPLAFLGQLSLHEMSQVAELPGWPRQGLLAFFFDASQLWGFSPLHRGHCRVLYFHEETAVVPAPFPEHLRANARYPARQLAAAAAWTLPGYLQLDGGNVKLWQAEEYRRLQAMLNADDDSRDSMHRCGGDPQEIQGDMKLECQLVTHGIYCGGSEGYKDPRRLGLEPGAADWQLLAQFDSDEERLGWLWGDAGRVYFWARRQDIEAADFSNAWAILQCY